MYLSLRLYLSLSLYLILSLFLTLCLYLSLSLYLNFLFEFNSYHVLNFFASNHNKVDCTCWFYFTVFRKYILIWVEPCSVHWDLFLPKRCKKRLSELLNWVFQWPSSVLEIYICQKDVKLTLARQELFNWVYQNPVRYNI